MDLLIIGHGSKSDRWNREILDFVDVLKQIKAQDSIIHEINPCFLEHQSPSIPDAIQLHQKKSPLVLIPLFLSISDHVVRDIPEEIERVCVFEKKISSTIDLYLYNNNPVYLLQPPQTADLIATNAVKRYQQWNKPNVAALLVYYGSKKYDQSWNQLGTETVEAMMKELPATQVDFEYGGHVVDFSPEPIRQKLDELLTKNDAVILLPALVSVGVIQDEVIPKAIESCMMKERVFYQRDSILPDTQLTKFVLDYVEQSVSDL